MHMISAHVHDLSRGYIVHVGKGCRQHMSKLHDIIQMQGTHGVCVLKALVFHTALVEVY